MAATAHGPRRLQAALSSAEPRYMLLQEQQTRRISELTARVEGLEKRLQDASKVCDTLSCWPEECNARLSGCGM